MIRRRRWGRGFTLLEVMAAMALVGIGLVGILQAIHANADAAQGAIHRRTAMLIAEEEMVRLEMTELGFDDPMARLYGDDKPMSRRFPEYRVEAQSADASDQLPFETEVDLRELTVSVSWGNAREPFVYSLVSYLIVDEKLQ